MKTKALPDMRLYCTRELQHMLCVRPIEGRNSPSAAVAETILEVHMKKRLATLVVALSIVVGTATAANAMSFRTLVNDLTGNSYYGNPYYGGYSGYGYGGYGYGYNPYVGYSGYNPYYGYGGYTNPYYGYGYGGYSSSGSLINSLGGLLYNFF